MCYNAKKSWGALAPLAPSPPIYTLGYDCTGIEFCDKNAQ